MKNTSAGYHTFAFYQKISSDDFSMLTSDFRVYKNKNKDIYDYPIKNKKGKIIGWAYAYKRKKESAGN
ncbi:hypothetical protein D1159_18040 [Pseudoflavonifractor sp. 524-17]|nr:hypothetical protein [Pseudoflavonifractor sp. 524-17]